MNDNTKNNKKLISVILLLVLAAVAAFGVWYFNYRKDNSNIEQQQTVQTEESASLVQVSEDGKTVSYNGIDNQNALYLLKQYTTVETEEFAGVGEYVVSINGVSADSTNNFWGFYVNGEQAQVGAGEYKTLVTDKIEWRLEDVEAFEE